MYISMYLKNINNALNLISTFNISINNSSILSNKAVTDDCSIRENFQIEQSCKKADTGLGTQKQI